MRRPTGKATVVKRQETDFGTVVTYRTTLDDGRDVTWAGSPEDVMTPEQRTERQKQLGELLAAGKFEFVRKFTTPDGVTMYSYRVRMPDGTIVHHASILPDHDPEKAKQLQQEIDRAQAEHKGTLVSVVEPLKGLVLPKGMEPPKSTRMYMYKVKLSNGDVSMYSTPTRPRRRTRSSRPSEHRFTLRARCGKIAAREGKLPPGRASGLPSQLVRLRCHHTEEHGHGCHCRSFCGLRAAAAQRDRWFRGRAKQGIFGKPALLQPRTVT